jgi:hypothetical protein
VDHVESRDQDPWVAFLTGPLVVVPIAQLGLFALQLKTMRKAIGPAPASFNRLSGG